MVKVTERYYNGYKATYYVQSIGRYISEMRRDWYRIGVIYDALGNTILLVIDNKTNDVIIVVSFGRDDDWEIFSHDDTWTF